MEGIGDTTGLFVRGYSNAQFSLVGCFAAGCDRGPVAHRDCCGIVFRLKQSYPCPALQLSTDTLNQFVCYVGPLAERRVPRPCDAFWTHLGGSDTFLGLLGEQFATF